MARASQSPAESRYLGDALRGEGRGRVPVILVEGVLDGDDGVVFAEVLVQLQQLGPACQLPFSKVALGQGSGRPAEAHAGRGKGAHPVLIADLSFFPSSFVLKSKSYFLSSV